jgi:hypothetical protein
MTNRPWFNAYREKHFDRIHGINTAGKIELAELGVTSPDLQQAIPYEGSSPEVLVDMLSDLPIQFKDYVFVDLGCGKGLALLIASMFSFDRIVGVEWSSWLAEIARDNARKFRNRRRKCRHIEVVVDDVRAFALPETPLVIYMFNPFQDEIVRDVLQTIRDSLNHCPRHIVLMYYNPVWKQCLEKTGFLQLTSFRDNGLGIAVYESERMAPALPDECVMETA